TARPPAWRHRPPSRVHARGQSNHARPIGTPGSTQTKAARMKSLGRRLNVDQHWTHKRLAFRNRVFVQFAERLVPLRFTPTVVGPAANVVARPTLTGAFAMVG